MQKMMPNQIAIWVFKHFVLFFEKTRTRQSVSAQKVIKVKRKCFDEITIRIIVNTFGKRNIKFSLILIQ